MSDDLDKFLAARSGKKREQEQQAESQREQEAQKLRLFANSWKTEWRRLQEDLKTLAEGKSVDGEAFQWNPNPRTPSLILGKVAAAFSYSGENDGILEGCRIVFGRKGDHQQYADDPPLEPMVWHLDFATNAEGREIMWMIEGRHETICSSRDLVSAISKQLVKYHDSYEEALAQWNPFE
jgi:hypothetical protein